MRFSKAFKVLDRLDDDKFDQYVSASSGRGTPGFLRLRPPLLTAAPAMMSLMAAGQRVAVPGQMTAAWKCLGVRSESF